MAIQQSTSTTVLTQYEKKYRDGADFMRLYDQFAGVLKPTYEPRGSTVTVLMGTDLVARPTTAIGSQTADFDPQDWGDVSTTVSADYYADGVKLHEKAQLVNYSDVLAETSKKVGMLAQETIDALARRQVTQASIVFRGTNTTRATLDQGTPGDRMRQALFTKVNAFSQHWNTNKFIDGSIMCVMTPWQFADLVTESGSNILLSQGYTERGGSLLLNYELAKLYGIRIVVAPHAKVFWAAGAANASAISTTLSAATAAGATSITVASASNIDVGDWIVVGTVQTGNESDATYITEPAYVTSVVSTTIGVLGSGPLGGLRFAHASGAAVGNADSVHCAVFGGPNSMVKIYDGGMGEYGELVPPFETGNAKQWTTVSFKWWGGYGLINQGWLMRAETSSTEI